MRISDWSSDVCSSDLGRVPAAPLSPFGTVAHLGPMTRTVRDAALMLREMARPDARDWFSLPHADIDYTANLGAGVKGLRIAYSPTLGYAMVDKEVAGAVAAAARQFSDMGAIVEDETGSASCRERVVRYG